jgi:chemotaxis protein histidine kinase CheA
MKKIIIPLLLFLPLTLQAQVDNSTQQQLEAAQKQLQEAQKALDAAKKAAEAAQKAAESAKKEAETAKKEAESAKKETTGWAIPTAEETARPKTEKVQTNDKGEVLKVDAKYLDGAVTTNSEGKVVFETTIDVPGKTADEIYSRLYDYMVDLTQQKDNISSRVALVNKDNHTIANTMVEYLVFSNNFISLDRTEFKYNLIAEISDGSAKITMNRMSYNYDAGRSTGFKGTAEEIITDKYALNKKKTNLAKIYGKFRRGTIDRKDQLFSEIKTLLQVK